MSDPPPPRSLRILLAGLVLVLAWGCAAPVAAEVRSDTPTSDLVIQARLFRAPIPRLLLEHPDLGAPPAPEAAVAEVVIPAPMGHRGEPGPPAPHRLDRRTGTPRAPPGI